MVLFKRTNELKAVNITWNTKRMFSMHLIAVSVDKCAFAVA